MSHLCRVASIGTSAGGHRTVGVRCRPAERAGAGQRRDWAACRQRANQVYEQQNRGQIFSTASQVNSPFSNNYAPGDTNRGLSDVFAHDRMVNDCVRNTGTGAERAPPSPSSSQ